MFMNFAVEVFVHGQTLSLMRELSNAINFANINHANLNLKRSHMAKQRRDK